MESRADIALDAPEAAVAEVAVEESAPPVVAAAPAIAQSWPHIVGWVVFGFALLLYTLTLAPSVMPGDYAEFQLSAAVLGVPHPTGYPLYILLGKLFTLLPLGDVAYRVNFSSALYMTGAAGVLYAIAVKLFRLAGFGRVWWAAAVGALVFAVAPTVWSMSLVARSYALNALLVACVIFSLITWRQSGQARWFYASCLLIGLSMVHHGTTYLLLPAYGLYLLLVEIERHRAEADRRPMARRALGVLSLLAGLSPMLFLVYRFVFGSPYYWGNPTSWKDFFNLLTGGPFHNQVMGFGDTQLDRVLFGLGELDAQYTLLGIIVGVAGMVALWRLRRAEAALLTLMMLGNFAFAMNYSLVGYLYFIPTFLIWGVFIAVGAGWMAYMLIVGLSSPLGGVALRARTAIVIAVAILLWLFASSTILRYPNIDQSGQTATRDEALALLASAPQGASLYLDWEDVSVVRFYRMVYGSRPDLTLHSGDPSDWPKGVYCDLNNGAPVYVGEFAGAQPPNIARDFEVESAPMGWRVVSIKNAALYEMPPCGTCATCR
jgi:hypothetical protein